MKLKIASLALFAISACSQNSNGVVQTVRSTCRFGEYTDTLFESARFKFDEKQVITMETVKSGNLSRHLSRLIDVAKGYHNISDRQNGHTAIVKKLLLDVDNNEVIFETFKDSNDDRLYYIYSFYAGDNYFGYIYDAMRPSNESAAMIVDGYIDCAKEYE